MSYCVIEYVDEEGRKQEEEYFDFFASERGSQKNSIKSTLKTISKNLPKDKVRDMSLYVKNPEKPLQTAMLSKKDVCYAFSLSYDFSVLNCLEEENIYYLKIYEGKDDSEIEKEMEEKSKINWWCWWYFKIVDDNDEPIDGKNIIRLTEHNGRSAIAMWSCGLDWEVEEEEEEEEEEEQDKKEEDEKEQDKKYESDSDDEDSDSDDEDEEWGTTVYETVRFSKRGGKIKGYYLSTYGGGPEGGYVISDDNKVYTCHRDWGTLWNTTRHNCEEIWIKISEDADWKIETFYSPYTPPEDEEDAMYHQIYPGDGLKELLGVEN
jgi:hypothetical protein